ncbi:MAG: Endoribonuclease MazF9 [Chloroflexi bacterium]|nr:Endoribonuclease MazF9 [Chloroflexota bacterium]
MKRGEVWQINLDPTIGSEIKKSRPCVIVNRDSIGILPLKIIVPITGWQEKFKKAKWLVPIEASPQNGLHKKSAADTFQVRSVSQTRFIKKIGVLSKHEMRQIEFGLLISLDLEK